MGCSIKNGVAFTGQNPTNKKTYVAGKLANTTVKGTLYKNGIVFSGMKAGKMYDHGKLANRTLAGRLYKNGRAFNGWQADRYYTGGKKRNLMGKWAVRFTEMVKFPGSYKGRVV